MDGLTPIIEPLITAVGIVVGVLVVYVQIAKQHRSSLALQEEHLKNQLRLQIYGEIADQIEIATESLIEALSATRGTVSTFELVQKGVPIAPAETSQSLSEKHYEASEKLSGLIRTIERYEVAFPGYASIRHFLVEEDKRFGETFSGFYQKVALFIPLGERYAPEADVSAVFPLKPSGDDVAELARLAQAYDEVGYDFHGYLYDLRVAAQNTLLGSLFARTLQARKPSDPNVRVLVPDDPRSAGTRPAPAAGDEGLA